MPILCKAFVSLSKKDIYVRQCAATGEQVCCLQKDYVDKDCITFQAVLVSKNERQSHLNLQNSVRAWQAGCRKHVIPD